MLPVELTLVDDNPYQARQDYPDIEELARRIAAQRAAQESTYGLLQVPVGRLVAADDGLLVPWRSIIDELRDPNDVAWWQSLDLRSVGLRVQLAFGHRRKRAFDYLNGSSALYSNGRMPIILQDMNDDAMLDAVWSENHERRDVSAVEEARLLQLKLDQLNGAGQAAVAQAWGLARSTVSNRLSLLHLPDDIQEANRHGQLSERQCLALKTIAKLREVANEKMADGQGWDDTYKSWGTPMSPGAFIEYAIKNDVSGDEIREMSRRQLVYAGEKLPKIVASHTFNVDDDVHQQNCRGCCYRIDSVCIKLTCCQLKKMLFADQKAREVAADLGLPYSDDATHFEPFVGWDGKIDDLGKLYKSGVSDDVVVGFTTTGTRALRPLTDEHFYYSDELWNDDGEALVILGHKKPIGRAMIAHAEAALLDKGAIEEGEIEDIPEIELAEWDKAIKKAVRQVKKKAMAALVDAIMFEVAEFNVIQALFRGVDTEWLDDTDVRKAFIEFLVAKGAGVSYWHIPLDEIEGWSTILDRADIGHRVLWRDDVERLSLMAMVTCCWYYGRREWRTQEMRDRLQSLRDEIGACKEPGLEMWIYELDRALRDFDREGGS